MTFALIDLEFIQFCIVFCGAIVEIKTSENVRDTRRMLWSFGRCSQLNQYHLTSENDCLISSSGSYADLEIVACIGIRVLYLDVISNSSGK